VPVRATTVTAYNMSEAARKVGISRVTLWRHVRDGKLPVHRSGRDVLVMADDLLDYVLTYHRGIGIPQS
jgi:excisionase family DNA binding protein